MRLARDYVPTIVFLFDIALQSLTCLGKLIRKVAEFDLLDWVGRVKLIDCICNFILLSPEIGQVIIFGPSPCTVPLMFLVLLLQWLK